MLASVVHILPLTRIRRERILPVSGKVLVRRGQKVGANDVIAEAKVNPEHLLLNIARGLGLNEDESDKYLQCKAGMQVAQGDVLAGPVGFTKRVVRTPKNGRVIVAGGGQVLLEMDTAPLEVKAGLPGIVSSLIEEHGAVIEAAGALIQGVWGNGAIDSGMMNNLLQSAEDELTTDHLDVSQRGSIILGGYCGNADVLKTAASLPLRGLILSSMHPSLTPLADRMRLPVIVIEGFGRRALNSVAYQLLTTNDRRDVAINAQRWDRGEGTRPEIVIPLPVTVEPDLPPDTDTFHAGQQVRAVNSPHPGKLAKIITVLPGSTTLPSGVNAPAAEVQFENGEKSTLPLANLEVLE